MKALLSIAAADDNIAPPELERIKAAAKRFGCRLKASDLKTFSLDGIARGISRPHVQKAVLAEIVDIAKADRKLSSDELQIIKYLCSQWGLPLPDVGVGWEQVRSPGDKKSIEELDERTRSGIVTSKLRAINATSQSFSVKWVLGSLIIMALLLTLAAVAIDQGMRRGHIQSGAQTRNAYLIGLGLTFFLGGFLVGLRSAGRTVIEPAVAAFIGVFGGLYALTLKVPTFQDLKGDYATLAIFAAVPFFVSLIGSWVGELIQRSKAEA
jgi:hypothetical protein